MSFCGTAEYLAPEVLLAEPYSYEVDIWSAGTMLFEMLAGITPFYASDHASMYRRVLHDELSFEQAEEEFDPDTRTVLRGMLQRDPLLRITIPRLKRMPYFNMISWDWIREQRYLPPFVPNLNPLDPTDTSQFDNCFVSMPAEVKGTDPEHEPGAARDPPEGEAQPALDERGRDVFDGYSYYGRDSASIHEDDFGGYDSQAAECSPAAIESDPHDGIDREVDTATDRHLENDPLQHGHTSEPITPASFMQFDLDYDMDGFKDEPSGGLRTSSPVGLGFEGLATERSEDARARDETSVDTPAEVKLVQDFRESEDARVGLHPSPEETTRRSGETSSLAEEVEPDSDAEWVTLETNLARASVRNGGRESTLWQRGFRDKYRMALAPLASPLRPPRSSKIRHGSHAGSSSSAISSMQVSPSATPELSPSSPRPLIRRFTSPRPSLGSDNLRNRESQQSLDAGVYSLSPAGTAAPSLAPSRTSNTDRGSPLDDKPRKSSPMKRLAKSASGFIEKF
ncbi:hypothetical protein JCM10908_005404 [Rhodotorula pacifica]|uniref:uncharacterized protein n=1 Tax=Rhodotorula pacifica TaxID=1495444 RepID=UPI00317A5338